MSGSAVSLIRPAPAATLETLAGTAQLTVAQSDNLFLVNVDDDVTIVLPPCRGQDVGTAYEFIFVNDGGGIVTISTTDEDVFIGNVIEQQLVNEVNVLASDGATHNVLTLDGPGLGNRVQVEMVSSTQWAVIGKIVSAGGDTGFSNE